LAQANENPLTYIIRYSAGDWGDLSREDMRANTEVLKNGGMILSAYVLGTGVKLWVITEAQDDEGNREATTILLPSEY
jgi:hypothetical protein